jgi:hypothetical protein
MALYIRKKLKEGTTTIRKPTTTRKYTKVEIIFEFKASTSFSVGFIELEVWIMDKIIPNALVDKGNGLNIMFLSTTKKSSLKIIGPSPNVVSLIDQNGHIPNGQITNYKVYVGDEKYNFIFHVIHLQTKINVYSLFLGKTWL